jgi:hypothetical protein
MGQVTQAFPHLELERVKQKLKQADKYWERQKWLVFYNAMIDPRPAAEIARHTGVSKGFVRQVIQQYNRQGEAAVCTPGKGGRRNCYLSWEQEQRLELAQGYPASRMATVLLFFLAWMC